MVNPAGANLAIDQALTLMKCTVSAVTQHFGPASAVKKPSVVIVGGAFAGLRVQRELSKKAI